MKSLSLIAVFAFALSLCNFSDRSSSDNRNASQNTIVVAEKDVTNDNVSTTGVNANSSGDGNTSNGNAPSSGGDDLRSETALVLMLIKRRWTQAILDGDQATCREILAEGFVNTDPRGSVTSREQYIGAIRSQNLYDSFTVTDPRLINIGTDSATMTYVVRLRGGRRRRQSWRDTDHFVIRNGRWQIISSASSPAR